MKKIINETETVALEYFQSFGFDDAQIDILISQGKKDLEKELKKLKTLLHAKRLSYIEINHALHALKGLFFQLGNNNVAEKLHEIKSQEESNTKLKEIVMLLGL